jgi:electron transfer flavoprotein alpha subunit
MNQDIYVVIEHLRGQIAEISYTMLAAAHALAGGSGGKVFGVLLGKDVQKLAENLAADQVLYVDHQALAEFNPDAYLTVLTQLIGERQPRAVLLGSTTIGSDVVGGLSIKLNAPLISQCQQFLVDGGTAKAVSKICGGKIMTEIELPETTTLISMIPGGYGPEDGQGQGAAVETVAAPSLDEMRVALSSYIEPEAADVDLEKEPIIVAVGRGIQTEDNIELAQDLADLLGGVVAGSRPVVDQGWLATSRLVGKSGKHVKPKIYLTLGISGAPEHVEGITGSETIIAINSDPNAPIFNVAKYGVNMDLFDLIDPLIEKVEEAKGVRSIG